MVTLYIGNLQFSATEDDIKELFGQYGEVHSVKLIIDHESNRSRGFGFVEMDDENGMKAIEALNGNEFYGRNIKVNEAREKKRFNRR